MHPLVWLGASAVAIVFAWFGLRGGQPRAHGADRVAGGDGALEPGSTRGLSVGGVEEEPFKREELPFADRPYYTGGEYGGGYGPQSGEGGAAAGGFAESPGPTQTYVLSGDDVLSGDVQTPQTAPWSPTYHGSISPSSPYPIYTGDTSAPGVSYYVTPQGAQPVAPGTNVLPGTVLAQ